MIRVLKSINIIVSSRKEGKKLTMKLNELENLIKQLEENGQTKEADNLKVLLSLLN